MSDEEIFSNSRIKGAMSELMKSEEGRVLAENLRSKLKELNDQFKGLSGEEKQAFLHDFRNKFSDSLGDLKDTLKIRAGEKVDGEFKFQDDDDSMPPFENYVPLINYWPFLVAVLIILLIFGYMAKNYLLITLI